MVFVIETAHKTLIYVRQFSRIDHATTKNNWEFVVGKPAAIQTKKKILHAPYVLCNVDHVRYISGLPDDTDIYPFKYFKGFRVKDDNIVINSLSDLKGQNVTVMTTYGDIFNGTFSETLGDFIVFVSAEIKKPAWRAKGLKFPTVPIRAVEYLYGPVVAVERLEV